MLLQWSIYSRMPVLYHSRGGGEGRERESTSAAGFSKRLSRWGIHALDPRDRVSPSTVPIGLKYRRDRGRRSTIQGNRRVANRGLPVIAVASVYCCLAPCLAQPSLLCFWKEQIIHSIWRCLKSIYNIYFIYSFSFSFDVSIMRRLTKCTLKVF